jgi:hypothetical protein
VHCAIEAAAQSRQAYYANQHRRDLIYQLGDRVLLSTENLRASVISGTPKLLPKYIGPYTIKRKISDTAYELTLPPTMKIHPVFHIHLLKPYQDGLSLMPHRIHVPIPEPELIDDEEPAWEIESILKKRKHGWQVEYLIKWKEYPLEEATWEPLSNLQYANEAIQEYEQQQSRHH